MKYSTLRFVLAVGLSACSNGDNDPAIATATVGSTLTNPAPVSAGASSTSPASTTDVVEKVPPEECNVAKYEAWVSGEPADIAIAERLCPNTLWLGGPAAIYRGLDGADHTVLSPYPEGSVQDGFIDTSNLARLTGLKTRSEVDAILVDLFGTPALPQELPTLREADVEDDHPYKAFLPDDLRAATRVDAYSSELHVPANNLHAVSTHIVYRPRSGIFNGRVVILIQGHADALLEKEASHFLAAGYAVILRGLLGFGNDNQVTDGVVDYQGFHDGLYALESPDFNPMTLFIQPNILAVNLAVEQFPGAKIVVAGLSGGAQMALLVHAFDPRIARSISVSGWKPFFLRYREGERDFEGDYEQNTNRFYFHHRIDYLDLVLLATRGSRKHYQVWITRDPGYFGGEDYRHYADQLSALTNGKYVLIVDEATEEHAMQIAHLDAFFEIDAIPPPPRITDAARGLR